MLQSLLIANRGEIARRIIRTARRMGIVSPLIDSPSLPIGAVDVNVLEMTSAYAVFANGGHTAPPSAILDIRNSRGDVLYRRGHELEAY